MKKVSDKQRLRNAEKSQQTAEMFQLFRQIWDEREDETGYCYCFETGRAMHGADYRSNSAVYDHVLEKQMFPQYRMNKENIVIVHPEVHQQKGNNIDNTPKIKKYRDSLYQLHLDGKLEEKW